MEKKIVERRINAFKELPLRETIIALQAIELATLEVINEERNKEENDNTKTTDTEHKPKDTKKLGYDLVSVIECIEEQEEFLQQLDMGKIPQRPHIVDMRHQSKMSVVILESLKARRKDIEDQLKQ